jgi:hypothetical protein
MQCVHFIDVSMSSVTKCSLTNARHVERVLRISAPLPNLLCREQVPLAVTDAEFPVLLSGVADLLLRPIWGRSSSVSVVTRPREGPVAPTDPFFQRVLGVFCSGKSGRVMTLTSRPHLVLRLRTSGAIPTLPCVTMTCRGQAVLLLILQ